MKIILLTICFCCTLCTVLSFCADILINHIRTEMDLDEPESNLERFATVVWFIITVLVWAIYFKTNNTPLWELLVL